MKIILASASPRRKELLQLVIPKFDIIVSTVEEKIIDELTMQEQATRLAYIKAKDVFNKTKGDRIIIGSDTIVTKNKKIYGKPKEMIKELLDGDKIHSVITGLCVMIEEDGKYKEYKTYDEVKVYLKDISEKEIEKWLDTGKASDRAGAYGIQDEFCVHIDKIEGNYTTVVGLPVHKLYDILKTLKFEK